MSDTRHCPWSCGTQHADWHDRNCDRCAKCDKENLPDSPCEVLKAIVDSMFVGEGLSEEMAKRCGYLLDDGETRSSLTWDCPERETT